MNAWLGPNSHQYLNRPKLDNIWFIGGTVLLTIGIAYIACYEDDEEFPRF